VGARPRGESVTREDAVQSGCGEGQSGCIASTQRMQCNPFTLDTADFEEIVGCKPKLL